MTAPERALLPVRLSLHYNPRGKPEVWKWTGGPCPFCGEEHNHGGGAPAEDPRNFLGGRVPHCVDRSQPGDRQYALVDLDPAATAAMIVRFRGGGDLRPQPKSRRRGQVQAGQAAN